MRSRRPSWKRARSLSAVLVLILASAAVATAQVLVQPAPVPGGTLDPTTITKYVEPLTIPPAMPKAGVVGRDIDYYEIAARPFQQQILPPGLPKTTVFGYGAVQDPSTFHYPAFTIEADVNEPVRVKWVNDLKDATGKFRSHLFPIDQTLHWANPPQDCIDGTHRSDCRGKSQQPYQGPVPIITHLHGAHVKPDSDGYPEAWYLPDARNIPRGFARQGSHFGQIDGVPVESGAAVFQYSNDQRATTLWYHDHVLGMTRVNVYSGLAGFYLLRGGSLDVKLTEALLPKPAPKAGDPAGTKYFEIPLIFQDKAFNKNGSLFFPSNRAFFERTADGVPLNPPPTVPFLDIPFIPDPAFGGPSDISPIWNPEFFGNTMVVNGKTWPKLNVEQRRYRFRLLNGDDTRVLFLKIVKGDPTVRPGVSKVPFWQIGADGGFLPAPVKLEQLLIAPAERVDVIVDFTNVAAGTELYLINEGPDEPFGGGAPGVDFAMAHPGTTGQVMKFIVGPRTSFDASLPPALLPLPNLAKLGPATKVRTVSLNEAESATVFVVTDANGSIIFDPTNPDAVPHAPAEALLGTATVKNGVITPTPREWMDPITEKPALNSTEIWEIYDFTEDAHPIHIHQVQFEVINRQDIAIDESTGTATLVPGTITPPEAGETGTKDTVLVYPGRMTRVKAHFDIPGLYVWHCHIISHEDNEMMRPYCVGDPRNCQ
jgi:FtsP/CotA-like multicopper oxidase with cupredoxin domain